jgi:putative flavoprotein involved in K+ transport
VRDSGILDVAVVGAGWAGLGVSYALQELGLRHVVLERGAIAETWRRQRWDSFHMNTPNIQTVMPGDRYDGPGPEGAMSCHAFVALLEGYAARNGLPIRTGTPVISLTSGPDGLFDIAKPGGALRARAVVAATGSLNCPRRPAEAAAMPADLLQIDAAEYRNPAELPSGAVLVVGSAQSGAQIADELAAAGRPVFLATGATGRLPRRYRGRDISVWLELAGLYDVPRHEFVGPEGRVAGRPTLGALRTISLQSLSAAGVTLLGRFTGVTGGRLRFGDDLAEHIRLGDEGSAATKRKIDAYIEGAGLEAPPADPDPAEVVASRLPDPPITDLDPAATALAAVVWCTGLRGDFGWISVSGALDASGEPIHDKCVSPIPGLCFAGLDLAVTRRSGIVPGVTEEAPRLARAMAAHIAHQGSG